MWLSRFGSHRFITENIHTTVTKIDKYPTFRGNSFPV